MRIDPHGMPGLSVLVAAHNEEKTIGNLLAKLLAQSLEREVTEIIVVSSGSTDRTNSVIASFQHPLVTFIEERDRKGKVNALRTALPHVSGGTVLLLDADVDIDERLLETCFQCISSRHLPCTAKIVPVAHYRSRFFRRLADVAFTTWNTLREKEDREGDFLYPSGHTLLLPRDALRYALGQMEDETINDDALLAYLLFEKGIRFRYNQELVVQVGFPQTFADFFRQKVRSRMGRRQVHSHFFARVERQWRSELVASMTSENAHTVLLLWLLDSASRALASVQVRRCAEPHLWNQIASSKDFLAMLLFGGFSEFR
jgi:glycosyltransferase involved in cell wall biosynthesis